MKYSLFILQILCTLVLTAQQEVIIEQFAGIDSNTRIFDIEATEDNTKYIATDKGVYKILSNANEAILIKDGSCQSIYATNSKGIWAAFSDGSIQNLDGHNGFNIGIDGIIIKDICYSRSRVWVGTNKGLLAFNASSGKLLEHSTTKNSKLESDIINFVHVDAKDEVWVGTEKGVAWIVDKEWKKLYDKGLNYLVIHENNEGKWMISDQEMYLVFDNSRWQPLGLEKDLYSGTINDLAIDNKGKLYIASDVLVRLDPYSNSLETYSDDLALVSKKCVTIETDNNNHVWIGTAQSGLYRIKFADNEAELLTASCIIDQNPKCNKGADGSIIVSAAGGEKPYKYTWSDSSLRGKNPKSLKAGKYEVTVTDKNNQKAIASIELLAPSPLDIQIKEMKRISRARANDGKVVLDIKGGTPPYEYAWSTGEKSSSSERLPAGNHSLTVTDQNKCSEEAMVFIPKEKFIPELDITKLDIGQTLLINELYFSADSSEVSEKSFEVLDEILDFLSEYTGVIIEIGGHTNGIPSHEYCDKLSSERARNVANYLYEKGITNERIEYKGYGKRNPIATNNSLAGRKKNQRVEIKILELNKG